MSPEHSRPRTLTLLALGLFAAAAFQAVGVIGSLQRWTVTAELALSVPQAYIPVRNGLLTLVFGATALGLWRRRAWGVRLAVIGLPLVAAWAPLERLWLARSEFATVSLPWTLFFSATWLALALGIVWRAEHRRA